MHRSSTCRPPHRKGPRANTHDPRIRSGMLHSLAPAQYLRTYTRTSVHDTGQPQNIVRTHSRSRPQTAGRRARTAEKYTLRSGEITSVHACMRACMHSFAVGGRSGCPGTHTFTKRQPTTTTGVPDFTIHCPSPGPAKPSSAQPGPVRVCCRSVVLSFVRLFVRGGGDEEETETKKNSWQ